MPYADPIIAKEYHRTYYRNYYHKNKEKYAETQRRSRIKNLVHIMWRVAKNRALKRGMEFDIEESDLTIPTECPILGIKIIAGAARKNGGNTPNSPSLDRIDSNKGYVKGNVQVISTRANWLKNNATTEELRRLAHYMTRLEGGLL